MRARDIIESSTVGQMPKVQVVVCPGCETPWNAASMTVASGRCPCGAPLRKEQAS